MAIFHQQKLVSGLLKLSGGLKPLFSVVVRCTLRFYQQRDLGLLSESAIVYRALLNKTAELDECAASVGASSWQSTRECSC